MKPIFYAYMITVLVFSACSSGKSTFERGNYYEAVITSVNRLRRNSDHKKSVETLRQAYPMAVAFYEDRAKTALGSSEKFKWTEVVKSYTTINVMHDEIKRCPGALAVIPNPVNYYAKLQEAKQHAAEEHYAAGIVALQFGDRQHAKEAYALFKLANDYVAGYKDVNNYLEAALAAATVKILVEPIPVHTKSAGVSAEFFNDKISEYVHSAPISEFVRFYTRAEAQKLKLNPDHIIQLQFDDFTVGQVYKHEKEVQLSKDSIVMATYITASATPAQGTNTVAPTTPAKNNLLAPGPGGVTPKAPVTASPAPVANVEAERAAREKAEKERLERERLERERLERERLERERLERERLERERLERERLERERLERERLERERLERERLEREKLERERLERERLEKERIARELAEKQKAAQAHADQALAEKLRTEKEAAERAAKEAADKVNAAAAQAEKDRLERARLETERLEKERLEKERLEKEKLEKERLEKERLEKERLEKEKAERELAEKLKAEKERAEKAAAEKALAEKAEKERAEKEKADKARAEKEKAEKARYTDPTINAEDTLNVKDPVTVCHIPPGNNMNARTLVINRAALKAHLAHGDREGDCHPENKGQKGNAPGNDKGGSEKKEELKKEKGPEKKGSTSIERTGNDQSILYQSEPVLFASIANDPEHLMRYLEPGSATIEGDTNKVYGTVKATLYHFTKTTTSRGVVSFRIVDAKTGALLSSEKLPGEFVWVSEWATFNGDERALSAEHLNLTKMKEKPAPPPQDLFIEFTRPIYDQITTKIREFYKNY